MGGSNKRTLAEKFWAKTKKANGCWLWIGQKVPFGHGRLRHNQKIQLAHRVSWKLHHGPIPDGMCVLHHCDVPACVNPFHLFLGTRTDNNADRDRKGRHVSLRGTDCPTARLSWEQVTAVRFKYAGGISRQNLAAEYNISTAHVSKIVLGQVWRWEYAAHD